MNINQLQATSSLEEWLSYLERQHPKAIDMGLERVMNVGRQLNLLKPAPFVITVGGTNGKGTSCRLLEAILIKSGLRVGVYSSPHIHHYNERVRIQNQPLSDAQHTTSFAYIEQHKTQSLTYFEFSTLSALHLFKQAQLDVVILEVGLGGRLDATNIVDSDISVVTSIGIDHVSFLGDTREKIAYEKAGIFRSGKPAVIGEPDVPVTLIDYAKKIHTPLFCCNKDWFYQLEMPVETSINEELTWQWQGEKCHYVKLPYPQIPLPNAATVLAVIEKMPFKITKQSITDALQTVAMPGRFQILNSVQRDNLLHNLRLNSINAPQIVLDVGHNPHAATYLATQLERIKQQKNQIAIVLAMLEDKDAVNVVKPLLPYCDKWFCAGIEGDRGQQGSTLYARLHDAIPNFYATTIENIPQAVKQAVRQLTAADYVIVMGSFHTVAACEPLLNAKFDI